MATDSEPHPPARKSRQAAAAVPSAPDALDATGVEIALRRMVAADRPISACSRSSRPDAARPAVSRCISTSSPRKESRSTSGAFSGRSLTSILPPTSAWRWFRRPKPPGAASATSARGCLSTSPYPPPCSRTSWSSPPCSTSSGCIRRWRNRSSCRCRPSFWNPAGTPLRSRSSPASTSASPRRTGPARRPASTR